MSEIEEIQKLIEVCDKLLGPGGCPWDQEQTMMSVRECVLEEVCELIEAIDLNDNQHIKEELGDLVFNAVFLGRLAEKENRCSISEAVNGVTEKLIRRHPHVFGEVKLSSSDDVIHQWESIKRQEKGNTHRKSVLDGIPKNLPALSRASKILSRMKKLKYTDIPKAEETAPFKDEDALGELLWEIVVQAKGMDLDAEHALRKFLAEKEREIRTSEESKGVGN